MKIMFLIPHLSDGGTEKVLSTLSCYLPKNIEQVIVVFEEKIAYPYTGKLISLNSPNRRANFLIRIIFFIKRFVRFRRIFFKEYPDLVVSFMEEANLLNVLVSKNAILTAHANISQQPQTIPTRIAKLCIRAFYRNQRIVAVSKGLKEDLIENFGLREDLIDVIYNPIEVARIRECKPSDDRSLSEQERIIVTCGRVELQKGHWHLLKAFSQIRTKISCRLVIIGSGSLKYQLQLLCDKLQISPYVDFLGWQENPYPILHKADLFVLSSLWETFGMVLVEAMACGIPVISSDCPVGPREILDGFWRRNIHCINNYYLAQFGILTPPFRQNEIDETELSVEEKILANAIDRILTDTRLYAHYSAQSDKRANEFNAEKITQEYVKYFQSRGNVQYNPYR